MFNYKEWYEKNREKQLLWQKNYYKENKEHVLEMHKDCKFSAACGDDQ